MTNEDLCYTPATELVDRMKSKDLSPVELTQALLDRIDALNPKLNAFVTIHPEQSLAAAQHAEDAIQKGEDLGSLHGLPISIKDLSHTKGVRTTSGSKVHENFIPDENAPVVERMLGAGAISLGKTNTPEFGWLAISDNELFGPTGNPWDPTRTSSGSSGGAASATAAGMAPISLGSDGGGSIRHPASFCGLVGMKATFGMIPKHAGHEGWPSLSHNGPLTRTVADAALAMDVLTGYDPRDMFSTPLPHQDFLKNLQRDLKGLRVAWSTDMGHAEVDPQVREHFEKSIAAFEEMGCEVVQSHPDLDDAREIFKGVMFVEAVGADLQHVREDGSSDMTPPLTQFINKRKDIYARDYMDALTKRQALYSRVHTFMQDIDLLLTPTMAIPAFEHPKPDLSDYPHTVNDVEVSSTGWHPFTFPFNLTGQPAATVPCGFTNEGLPVGLQIVGRKFEDLLVMQACAQFEQARPWADKRPAM